MKHHQKPIGKNDEWLTPRGIIDSLGLFDLDPCSPVNRPFDTAKNHFTIEDDSLTKNWLGRVWLNPPFSRKERGSFMKKMMEHGNGIMLIPSACETKHFKDYVWGHNDGILFLDHHPHFLYVDGSRAKANSGCTICLIAYGEKNAEALEKSGLGYFVKEKS